VHLIRFLLKLNDLSIKKRLPFAPILEKGQGQTGG
jgi:hypothetical protein